MATLSSLYSSVRLLAQQCPDTTIDKYLIEAIREFCRESWFYQEVLTQNITASTSDYTLTPSSSQELIAVVSVKVDGDPLDPVRMQDVDAVSDEYVHRAWKFEPNNTLTIYPEPTATITNGLVTRVAIMPPENTTTIPDVIYRHYKETIVAGALTTILSLQNEAWSNPQKAMEKALEFRVGVNRAKGQRMTGFMPGNLRTQPRCYAI